MPNDGLFRAGRWADIYSFPPAARPIPWSRSVTDGYRWEDIAGRFPTAKCSASRESAIGRTIARYRERRINGLSLVSVIKDWLSAEPEPGPPLTSNLVPPSYFDDAYLMRIPSHNDVEFIDLEHPRTQELVVALAGDMLELFGFDVTDSPARHRDRRVTRAIMTALHGFCTQPEYEHVAGIRYSGERHRHWDAYVLWGDPARIELDDEAAEVSPITLDDKDLQAAANTLGLDLPRGIE